MCRQIAENLRNAAELDLASHRDSVTGLPNLRQLEALLDTKIGDSITCSSNLTLLFVDIIDFREISALYGASVGNDVLRHVVQHCEAGLRRADILFRTGSEQFVVILNDVGTAEAEVTGEQIREAIHSTPLQHGLSGSIQLEVTVAPVSCPTDGKSFRLLAQTALGKTQSSESVRRSPTAL